MNWKCLSSIALVSLGLVACGETGQQGPEGPEGSSCSVEESDAGAQVTCDDGTSVTLDGGADGDCAIDDSGDETILECGDESLVLPDEGSCEVESADGQIVLSCDDGTETVVGDSQSPGMTRLAGALAGGASDGAGLEARMDGPMALDFSADGEFLYFTDAFNQTIRRYGTSSDQVVTLAGSPGVEGTDNGVGDEARFEGPRSLVVDPDEEYAYIADGFNCVIRRLHIPSREVTSYAGEIEFCDGVDGPVDNSRFGLITGMEIDDAGETLYVSDRGNDALRTIDIDQGEVETIAGQLGNGGYEDGSGDEALLDSPGGVALNDGEDRLYVADMSNDVIRAVDLDSDDYHVSTIAGEPYDPPLAELSDGMGGEARFSTPQEVVATNDRLYVFGFSNAVREITEDEGVYSVQTIAGAYNILDFVDAAFEGARFGVGFGAAATDDGQLFFGDLSNDAIRHLDLDNHHVETTVGASPDVQSYRADTGLDARFSGPTAVETTDDGAVSYIADTGNHVIRSHDAATGDIDLVAGTPETPGYRNGLFDAARFDTPDGLSLSDDESTLFVADSSNHVIRAVDLETGQVSTVAGDADTEEALVDGALMDAAFNGPRDIVADGDMLYISDSANAAIRTVDLDAESVDTLTGANTPDDDNEDDIDADGPADEAIFADPYGLALDGDGSTLFVSDGADPWGSGVEHDAIRSVDTDSGEVSTVAGLEADGNAEQSESVDVDEATFIDPSHIVYDQSSDALYVADQFQDSIRVIDIDEQTVAPAVGIPGAGGVTSDIDVDIDDARLHRPVGLDISADQTLIFSADQALFEARLPQEDAQ